VDDTLNGKKKEDPGGRGDDKRVAGVIVERGGRDDRASRAMPYIKQRPVPERGRSRRDAVQRKISE